LEFRSHTLENGLEVVAECNADAYSVAVGFFVNTGARDETDELAGVSHFLEHMVFKGTPRRTADDVNREFDEMGAQYNAYTSEENTVFYAAVLPEHQTDAVGLLADILRPSLREDDFNTEKQVILEEIQMYDDQPPFGADEKCRAAYFERHTLGRSVLGTVQSVAQLTPDAMQGYFQRRYGPGNVKLVGAGRIDFDALVATAQRCCGSWAPISNKRNVLPVVGADGFRIICKESATQQYVVQLAAGPKSVDSDRYPAKLLAAILGDDSGSRLYWSLVDPGLAESASVGHCEYEGAGVFLSFFICDPDRAADNLQVVFDEFRRAEKEGITSEELERAKNKVASHVVLASERPYRRLFNVGIDWLQRREYRTIRDDLNAVAAITVDDISDVLAKYPLSKAMTLTIGPLADVRQPR
jgi:predicted Zn-dependent peptidase